MGINQMLKRQEHFFQSQKTKDYEFRKKALLRLEYAIKKHEKEIEHALYKDLGKSCFESYMTEIGMVKSELSYIKKNLKRWMKPEQVKTPLAQFPSKSFKIKEPLGKVLIIAPWNYSFIPATTHWSDCCRKLQCLKAIGTCTALCESFKEDDW